MLLMLYVLRFVFATNTHTYILNPDHIKMPKHHNGYVFTLQSALNPVKLTHVLWPTFKYAEQSLLRGIL